MQTLMLKKEDVAKSIRMKDVIAAFEGHPRCPGALATPCPPYALAACGKA
jgi:hypothetical protein